MNYGTIKDDYGNIKRCVSFKLIETITVYNRGEIFYEYTRFSGDESYVIYDDGNIKTSHNENDATAFLEIHRCLKHEKNLRVALFYTIY